MESIARLAERMIRFSDGNLHDINHFLKVWAWARTLGELEGLSPDAQFTLEAAAITHDITCPLCREKYGAADGKLQEKEGPALVRAFLADSGLEEERIERIAFLVGHHHTLKGVDGMDWQILLEADFLVNAEENGSPREAVLRFLSACVRTDAAKRLFRDVFRL